MVIFSQCIDCKNFIGMNEKEEYYCKAFPEGISSEVFWNKISHKENIEGENGVKFEQIDYSEEIKKNKDKLQE